MYYFVAKHFKLDIKKVQDARGKIDEDFVKLSDRSLLEVFPKKAYPKNTIKSYDEIVGLLNTYK